MLILASSSATLRLHANIRKLTASNRQNATFYLPTRILYHSKLRRREVSLIESQNRNVQPCKRRAVDCRKKRARYYEQCALTFLSFYSSLTFIKFMDLLCMHYIVFLWQKNREFYKSKTSCFANFLTKLSHPDPPSKHSLFNSVHGMLGQMLSSTWPPNCPL